MHYHVELWLPKLNKDVEAQINKAMDPFFEENDPSGFAWDWFMVGGRYKGQHVIGYDPDKDQDHRRTCDLCKGTGTRTDMIVKSGCNGCDGTGIKTTWSTEWRHHPKDLMTVKDTPDSLMCYTLIVKGEAYETGWEGLNVKEKLAELGIKGGYLVTIDAHN